MLPVLQGAKAWVADVNARGGLNGHPVRLIVTDDQGDPSKTQVVIRQLVEQQKVQAIISPHAVTTYSSAIPYLEKAGVPVIGGCSCQDAPADESPIAFPLFSHMGGMHWSHLAGLFRYDSESKKVAVIYCRESPTCARVADGIEPMLKQTGRQLVYRAEASIAQPDFTAEVIAARNAGAEAIIAAMENASVIRIARTAHRQGWKPIISGQFTVYQQSLLEASAADLEGVVFSSNTVPWSSSPKMADYRAAMQRHVPNPMLANLGSHEWVVGKMLESVARGFPANPTPRDFIEGLYSLRGETFGGLVPPITYARNQGHGGTHQCVIPVEVKDGKFVPDGDDAWSCPPGYKPVGQ